MGNVLKEVKPDDWAPCLLQSAFKVILFSTHEPSSATCARTRATGYRKSVCFIYLHLCLFHVGVDNSCHVIESCFSSFAIQ